MYNNVNTYNGRARGEASSGRRPSGGRLRPSPERPERVLHDPQPCQRLVDLVERAVRPRLDFSREEAAQRPYVVVLGLDERVR